MYNNTHIKITVLHNRNGVGRAIQTPVCWHTDFGSVRFWRAFACVFCILHTRLAMASTDLGYSDGFCPLLLVVSYCFNIFPIKFDIMDNNIKRCYFSNKKD